MHKRGQWAQLHNVLYVGHIRTVLCCGVNNVAVGCFNIQLEDVAIVALTVASDSTLQP